MAKTGVPPAVEGFIGAQIESVEQLEVLLLLRGAPDKQWTAEEVARVRVSRVDAAAHWLGRMAETGLLRKDGERYRYAPVTPEVERTIDLLADSFAKYRVSVVRLIFSKPSEGVTRFSDAFRIRRQED